MLEVSLRLATEDDMEPLGAIHRAAMREHVEKTWGWDEEWQRTFFRDNFPFGQRQVVEYEGTMVGMLDVVRHDDHLELANIMMAPNYHRMGIGSLLVGRLKDEANKLGVPVKLQVLKVNVDARRLYERLGFEHHDETETHFLMRWQRFTRPRADASESLHSERSPGPS